MMTIWLFGDSFAQMNVRDIKDLRSWPELLAKNLNTNVEILGKSGTSLDYMFHIFDNNIDRVGKDDIIICCLTTFIRKWFIKDQPIITHGQRIAAIKSNPKQFEWLKIHNNQVDAIQLYEEHLNNPIPLETTTALFFRLLQYVAIEKNLKIVIMNFDSNITEAWKSKYSDFYYVDGYLLPAALAEFQNWKDAPMMNETRAGHFCYRNHKIIADRLEKLLQYKEPFNLNTDLEKKFISPEIFNDIEFRQAEFMDDNINYT